MIKQKKETKSVDGSKRSVVDTDLLLKVVDELQQTIGEIPLLKFPNSISDREQMMIYIRIQYNSWIKSTVQEKIDSLYILLREEQ